MKKEIFYLLPWLETNMEKITSQNTTLWTNIAVISLDENYGLVLGRVDGFDTNDKSIIHARNNPSCGLILGVKLLTRGCVSEYEDFDFPYLESGKVIAPEIVIRPSANLGQLLEQLLDVYEDLIHNYTLMSQGGLITENKK